MASADRFNPYRILGLERGATAAQVARAYRAAAKQSHPDLHGPDAEQRMQQLNRAFRLLSDPALRAEWDAEHPAGAPAAHWEHQRRSPAASAPGTVAANWAAWEVARDDPGPNVARVRAASAWPRDARQPTSPTTGLRDSAWPAVAVAAVLLVALLFLGWVASTPRFPASARQAFSALGLTTSSVLPLSPDSELAVARDPSGALLLLVAERLADARGWEAQIVAQVDSRHPISVSLYQASGAPGGFASIAFGRAEGEAAQVRLLGVEGRGGDVTNGTWAVALPVQLDAEDLLWEFLRADGSVLARGSGELNLP